MVEWQLAQVIDKGRNCVLCRVKMKNMHKERGLFIIALFHLLIATVERSMPLLTHILTYI